MLVITVADPQCLSFCFRALVLGIVRLVLRGRELVPYFEISSRSVFESKRFAVDWVQVPLFGYGSVLPSLFLVFPNNFCRGLLVMVLGVAVRC